MGHVHPQCLPYPVTQSQHPGAAPEGQWAGSQGRALCGQLNSGLLWTPDNNITAMVTAGKQGFWVMLDQSRSEGAPNRNDVCWLPDEAQCIQRSGRDSYCGLSVMRLIYSNFHLPADIVLIVIMNFNVSLVGCPPVQWHHSELTENDDVLSRGTEDVLACFLIFSSLFPLPQQERLSHIGPEEFVQAFVHKDPLDGTKVWFLHLVSCDHSLSSCDEVPKSRGQPQADMGQANWWPVLSWRGWEPVGRAGTGRSLPFLLVTNWPPPWCAFGLFHPNLLWLGQMFVAVHSQGMSAALLKD